MARLALLAVSLLGAACAGDAAPEPPAPAPQLDTRVRAPVPEKHYADLLGGELLVGPNSERMSCTHLRWDGDDIAFSVVETLQGDLAHHVELLTARQPLPPGTTVDCSDASAMAGYEHLALSNLPLPDGYAMSLKRGQQLVLQSHHINGTEQTLRARDVVRLRLTPISQVTRWVSLLVASSLDIQIPPHGEASKTFDCRLPGGATLLVVGGHMHHQGASFEALQGPDPDHLAPLYGVPFWAASFRDSPPLNLHFNSPIVVPPGGLLRATCSWKNSTSEALNFPQEMCDLFALVEGAASQCSP